MARVFIHDPVNKVSFWDSTPVAFSVFNLAADLKGVRMTVPFNQRVSKGPLHTKLEKVYDWKISYKQLLRIISRKGYVSLRAWCY